MKRFLGVIIAVVFVAGMASVSLAGNPSAPVTSAPAVQKMGKIIKVNPEDLKLRGANVIPYADVHCCWCKCNGADGNLEKKGFLLVDYINVNIYNKGKKTSGVGDGKIEFFDVLTNKKVVLRFKVPPVGANKYGSPSPSQFTGPYLVKKANGVKISLTYKDPSTGNTITNTNVTKKCSIVE